ncbi:CRISPR-associated protein, Csd2 family [Alkalispirochaeta americana]|uniref:CRISPR-associated protein, Csd2 family n=1 Tax=Alkalispirochaeta americana TaxID=159291 RepID=A0A1N6NDM1_9SPIO|nr:type I-C CRISPR-associated protein Cas7/Csd2 [Alkalispirochaeta americana]SIP90151.1 CRISPR-associated protein, Csd2 family [Alkalispirochaeta americana]
MTELNNRYEFVYLFDVENGNPNGDPDAGNLPRVDPETNYGIVTDVCLKRKVRNYVEIVKQGASPYEIYIREKAILVHAHERAHKAIGASKTTDGKRKGSGEEVEKAREWMCANFFDVRTFGAVMSLKVNCGQVRGPAQMNFARSIDPVIPREISITRMAVATEREAESQQGDNRTMGKKNIIPYGLYRAEGYISAHLAGQTGFSEEDLALFWEALINMFEHDHAAARGKMAARKLFVFKHATKLGNAPAHKLFETIEVRRASSENGPSRAFSDYQIVVHHEKLPDTVQMTEML